MNKLIYKTVMLLIGWSTIYAFQLPGIAYLLSGIVWMIMLEDNSADISVKSTLSTNAEKDVTSEKKT